MIGDVASSGRNSMSQPTSSAFSNTLVLRPPKREVEVLDMQVIDITDVGIRNKVTEILSSYPSCPLLYLVYVLVRSDGVSDVAREFLGDTRQNKGQYLSITYATSLKEIGDITMRDKVEEIINIAPDVTIWWAFYALQVCDGSFDCAIGLLFEGVVDASKDPATQVAPVSTQHVSPATSPMNRPDESLFVDLSSDSKSSVPSDTSGNKSFKPNLSSPELSHQTPGNLFIATSDDDKDFDSEGDDVALRASPGYSNSQTSSSDKGKGVDRSDPEDCESDINFLSLPPFEESPQEAKRHKKQNRNCRFCGSKQKNWLAQISHEKSCRKNTKQICVKCKRECSKSNIKRHEASCDGRQTSRRDGPEYEVRDSTRTSGSRDSFPDFDSSDSLTEDQLQKVKEMQKYLPLFSVGRCIESLGLSNYDVDEAIKLEMETLTSDDEVDLRSSYRRKDGSLKRELGSTSVG